LTGAQGATGPAGPTGPQGSAGPSSHPLFTATSTSLPAISLGGTSCIVLVMTPATSGDHLLTTDDPSQPQPSVDLPNGMNIAFYRVPANDNVRLCFSSGVTIGLTTTTINWRIKANR
jgi:hypothetical protein